MNKRNVMAVSEIYSNVSLVSLSIIALAERDRGLKTPV